MRITDSMVAQAQILSMQTNLQAVNTAQEQLSSGMLYQSASDNPLATTQIMSTSDQLAAVAQYQMNVSTAQSKVTAEDTALQSVSNILSNAQQVAESVDTAGTSAASTAAAQAQVEGDFNEAVSIASQTFGDGYLFGGDQSTTVPFTSTGTGASLNYTASTASGSPSVAIGPGQVLAPVHDGNTVFVASGVLDSLKNLAVNLSTGSGNVSNDITSLNSAFSNVQTLIGDNGARGQRLQTASSNLDALSTNLQTFQSGLQDVNVATATTNLAQAQTAYQAALLATSKVMGMSLANYLPSTT
jgi:flagellar hook-associated protein 3 FlgL